jgi:hypothetical protein
VSARFVLAKPVARASVLMAKLAKNGVHPAVFSAENAARVVIGLPLLWLLQNVVFSFG